jgi:hypothetical protein
MEQKSPTLQITKRALTEARAVMDEDVKCFFIAVVDDESELLH